MRVRGSASLEGIWKPGLQDPEGPAAAKVSRPRPWGSREFLEEGHTAGLGVSPWAAGCEEIAV